jgi:outer membrane protein assembly factor BamE (lipoprotein component of BamABCDE complex)
VRAFACPLILGVVLAALASCSQRDDTRLPAEAVPKNSILATNTINEGMTRAEVRLKLGPPTSVTTDGTGDEVWYYLERSANVSPGFQMGGLNILFQDGKVSQVQPVMVRTQRY